MESTDYNYFEPGSDKELEEKKKKVNILGWVANTGLIVFGILIILHNVLFVPIQLIWAFISLICGEWLEFWGVNFNLLVILSLFIGVFSLLFGILMSCGGGVVAVLGNHFKIGRMLLLCAFIVYFLSSLYTLSFYGQYWYGLVQGSNNHRALHEICKQTGSTEDCKRFTDGKDISIFSWQIAWGVIGLLGLTIHEIFNKLLQLLYFTALIAPHAVELVRFMMSPVHRLKELLSDEHGPMFLKRKNLNGSKREKQSLINEKEGGSESPQEGGEEHLGNDPTGAEDFGHHHHQDPVGDVMDHNEGVVAPSDGSIL